MEADVLSRWLGPLPSIEIRDEASVSVARTEVRRVAAQAGLASQAQEELAIAVSELARNQLVHALRGQVAMRPILRGDAPGIEVLAADRGPGIGDPAEALRGGVGTGLGQGLSAVHRLTDELDAEIWSRQGTLIRVRKFVRPPPYRRELVIVGRPYPTEAASGDDAIAVFTDDTLVLGVFDGLGHGPEAALASGLAVRALADRGAAGPDELLSRVHEELRHTRGAAGAIATIDQPYGRLRHTCRGNITTQLYTRDGIRRFGCAPGVLGRDPSHAPAVEDLTLGAGDVLLMYSDGIDTRVDLQGQRALLRSHPLTIASWVLAHHGREHDDATILVVG